MNLIRVLNKFSINYPKKHGRGSIKGWRPIIEAFIGYLAKQEIQIERATAEDVYKFLEYRGWSQEYCNIACKAIAEFNAFIFGKDNPLNQLEYTKETKTSYDKYSESKNQKDINGLATPPFVGLLSSAVRCDMCGNETAHKVYKIGIYAPTGAPMLTTCCNNHCATTLLTTLMQHSKETPAKITLN